jgi:hypothetical protein
MIQGALFLSISWFVACMDSILGYLRLLSIRIPYNCLPAKRPLFYAQSRRC